MAKTTTDHSTIQQWVQERGGVPSTVESTTRSDSDVGLLRIDFPHGGRNDELSTISWEDFFAKFEEAQLAFLHDDETAEGDVSRFCKFIQREDA
ncbi:hypothetical protein LOC71_13135 [Rhodopirellula sp. JC740]|uniref:1,4-alpha-glucan branching enzyme n=1 Tax=Rhodopirellula halodulae TaxID=2894198 RepID=A0ABS8NJV2_9BACT|nr:MULTISPECIES: hypothetical protein [unclassified Rhodopirellula]MCC9643222.1 hypothetical protein [Rhodopirellula sp. JC740]MCC9655029.1 hypothetical protein [Rhodopirellula sp. JC737]